MEIYWNPNQLSLTQNGVTVSQTALQGTFYLDIWTYAIFGYYLSNLTNLVCASSGLLMYITAPCDYKSSTVLSLNQSDLVYIGTNPVTLNSFTGFIYSVYIDSNYNLLSSMLLSDTSTNFFATLVSNCALCTSSGTNCSCGLYSCINSSNICNQCDASCGLYCTSTSPSNWYNIKSLCLPYYYNPNTGSCNENLQYISNCNNQTTSTYCSQCDKGYYLSPNNDICLPCSPYCATCSGGNSINCLTCSDPNALVSKSGSCNCTSGYYAGLSQTLVCLPCSPYCATCSGGNSINCLTCSDPNALISKSGSCNYTNGY
jgi:hypothetical protein